MDFYHLLLPGVEVVVGIGVEMGAEVDLTLVDLVIAGVVEEIVAAEDVEVETSHHHIKTFLLK